MAPARRADEAGAVTVGQCPVMKNLDLSPAAWVDTFSNHLGEAYRKVIRVDAAQADRSIEG